jgi:hypothetical protein
MVILYFQKETMSNSKAHDMEVKVEAMDKASVDAAAAMYKSATDETTDMANKEKNNEHHHHHHGSSPEVIFEKCHKQ